VATLGNFTAAVLTAAELNAIGTFTAWTPTLTNLTIGTTGAESVHRYSKINEVVVFQSKIVLGTGGSISGNFSITLPVTASATSTIAASVNLIDAANTFYPGSVTMLSTSELAVYAINAASTYASMQRVAAAVPFTWAAGDIITINGAYEAA
jgi:hypothetical protein